MAKSVPKMITDAGSKTKIRMEGEDGAQTPGPEILTIAKGAGIGFMGMVVGSALRYFFQIIIARNLGPELFGLFILGLTIFKVAGMIAEVGLPRGIVRYVALFLGEGDEGRLKGIITLSIRIALTSGIVFALLLFSFSRIIAVSIFDKSELTIVLRVFSLAIPFTTVTTMLVFAPQGFKIMKYSVIVRDIFEPLGRLILLVIIFLLGLKLYGGICAYLIPLVAGTWLAFHYLKKVFPPLAKKEIRPTYEAKKLLHFSWPLLFVNFFGLMVMWIDTLMLGYFKTSQDVGVYSAAQRTALLGCLIVASFNSIFAPVISDLHNRKEFGSLNEYFKTVAKWMFTFSLPISILIIFYARGILNLFGPRFVSGIPSLIILSMGWIIYSGVGSVGQIIIMSGRQKIHLANMTAVLIINIILNLFLIPRYGIIGAATATSISIALFRVIELIQVYLFLRIHPYRLDFLKPLLSGAVSLIALLVLSKLVININAILKLIIGSGIFFAIYILIIYILGLREEDEIVLREIKKKIFDNLNFCLEAFSSYFKIG